VKYGVLGDIHANISALKSVLACLDRERVDILLSVGDVVGYGAAPKECIALLRKRHVLVVKGNHDAAVAGDLDDRYFNPHARAAVAWTRACLDEGDRAWLGGLPLTMTLEHAHLSHGTYHRPELFDYIFSTTDADPSLDVMTRPVCFVGHSHVPIALMRFRDAPQRTAYSLDDVLDLADAPRSVVNVGSVGQPRDEDPRAAYAVYDSETRQARILRSDYDVEAEIDRILDAGLPSVLAERLRLGV
jgi:diadenosine tetraphosphatase ApaH/serine/threonine PP2A family protein phosphatase